QDRDFAGVPLHEAEGGIDRTPETEEASLAILGPEPRGVKAMMHRSRAEVPKDWIGTCTRQQRPAANLVALPLADLGRGEVTDVVDVHHQEGAEVGFVKCRPRARQPVTVQAAVVHPLLEIDTHRAECRQRAAAVVAWVDVLGADDSGLSDRLGHLCLLGCTGGAVSRCAAPLARLLGSRGSPCPAPLLLPPVAHLGALGRALARVSPAS